MIQTIALILYVLGNPPNIVSLHKDFKSCFLAGREAIHAPAIVSYACVTPIPDDI